MKVLVAALNVMVKHDGAQIAEQLPALDRQRWELEDRVHGLNFAVSHIAHTLPKETVVELTAQLRQLMTALQPLKRPFYPGLQAEQNRQIKQPWLDRFNELSK